VQSQAATGRVTTNGGTLFWAAILIAGVAVALTAQFLLDGWADGSDTAHQIQHGLLFWSGLMVGGAVLRLYQLGKRAV